MSPCWDQVKENGFPTLMGKSFSMADIHQPAFSFFGDKAVQFSISIFFHITPRKLLFLCQPLHPLQFSSFSFDPKNIPMIII
jgi:hypothetical protein